MFSLPSPLVPFNPSLRPVAVKGIQGRLLLERFNNFLAPKDLTIIKTDCSHNHSCVAWYFEHKKKICAWVRVTRRAGLG